MKKVLLSDYQSDVQGNVMNFRIFYRRHLPHYQPPGGTFFVTFGLAGAIPKPVLEKLLAERATTEARLNAIADLTERVRQAYLEEKRWFARWDAVLDRAESAPRWLEQPEIAEIVVEAMHHRDGKEYTLHAFTLMPTHAHMLFTPLLLGDQYRMLHKILQPLKSYSALKANRLLGREGAFWHGESYDHFVRDADEQTRIVYYIQQNPVKAGLVKKAEDWPWTYVRTSDW